MRTITPILPLLFCIFLTGQARAQQNDFGVWTAIDLSKKISKGNKIDFKQGLRLDNNAMHRDNLFSQIEYSSKLNDQLKWSVGYRYAIKQDLTNQVSKESRFQISLRHKMDLTGKLSLASRARFQTKFRNYATSEEGRLPTNTLRYRLGLDYDWSKKNAPYFSFEVFCPWNYERSIYLGRIRFNLGTAIRITKRVDWDLYYLIQKDLNQPDPVTDFVVGTGLSIKIK